jgi:predicted negative regulator of RcsB-dependent stress response
LTGVFKLAKLNLHIHLSHQKKVHVQGYTRRQLKEDRFAESAQEAAHWAAGHQRPLIVGILVAIVAILGGIGVFTWVNRQSDKANFALGEGMRIFNAPLRPAGTPPMPGDTASYAGSVERAKAAEKAFKNVADNYSMSKPGKLARYLEGVSAMQAGDNAVAEQELKAASESRDKEVASMAKMALASFYRSSNRQSDAARIYKELADHPTEAVSKVAAQLEMAEMYETTDPQQASSLYQQIQKENPQSPAAQIASSKLSGGKQPPGPPNF